MTQIFRLNHESAANLVPVLRPLISPNNTINVNPGTNALVITDYADNLQRLGKIIAAMDVSTASDVEIIQLKHAIATDLAPLVARPGGNGSNAGAPSPPPVRRYRRSRPPCWPNRSNALIPARRQPARGHAFPGRSWTSRPRRQQPGLPAATSTWST